MEKFLFLSLMALGYMCVCDGWPSGPPSSTCVSMTPAHGVNSQSSAPPYSITTSSNTYSRGQDITVTIQATQPSSFPFKGFLLQARRPGETTIVGRFSKVGADPEVSLLSCSGGANNAVGHASRVTKTSKQFIWNNPDGGDVIFQGTFVKDKVTIWTFVSSGTLSEVQPTTQPTTPASTTEITTSRQPTDTPQETTTTEAQSTTQDTTTTEAQTITQETTETGSQDGTTTLGTSTASRTLLSVRTLTWIVVLTRVISNIFHNL